jgi:hypothetical protein
MKLGFNILVRNIYICTVHTFVFLHSKELQHELKLYFLKINKNRINQYFLCDCQMFLK